MEKQMATTREDISKWFDSGVDGKYDFMFVICDTFDWEDYPVFCSTKNYCSIYDSYNGKNMQKIMEVYDLCKDKESQLNKARNFSPPTKSQ